MHVLEGVIFFIAAIFAVGGAFGVVLLRNPFFSVLALIMHLLALAALFLLLHAEFLAAAQIVVYAGAVMVLYLFVASYVGGANEPLSPSGPWVTIGPLFAAALFFELAIAALGTGLSQIKTEGATISPGFGGPAQFGELLLKRFLIPFEAASFLLLIAAVGAVVLARRRRGLEHFDDDVAGAPLEPGAQRQPILAEDTVRHRPSTIFGEEEVQA
jgi:NADH-quinone oxidoreductase subunit J